MTRLFRGLTLTTSLAALFFAHAPAPASNATVPAAQTSGLAITPEQLESDWLHPVALRQAAGISSPGAISREDDAAGGCDGIKTGKWGFHTASENNPWWQVDLGQTQSLDRVVIYNRCDFAAENASRILVLLSDDGKDFKPAYQHDGTVFRGQPDNKPLIAPLKNASARYVRLQLPIKAYLHLDEVEIYAPGNDRNIALNRPATQSSASEWSASHTTSASGPTSHTIRTTLNRAQRLASDLRGKGVALDPETQRLQQLQDRLSQLSPAGQPEQLRSLYLDARRLSRQLALKNPLLNFDSLLFVKAAPGQFPHMSDQCYGWWSRPGGGVFILENFKSEKPTLRCLTADMPTGSFLHADLSFDGKKILFAYCKFYPHVGELADKATKSNLPEDAFYHVFEMNADGSNRRQLTRGRYDDFDANYLPSGDIAFLSTRKGTFLQSTRANTQATLAADLPDSYVRCGGDNFRPVPVFTLHGMDAEGKNLRPLSTFENFEWTPSVADDGRILYTRWDYIDRFNGHFFSLWSTNPDGSNPQLVYGNYTIRPQVKLEAQSIPNSRKLVFTAAAHHSITGGSLVICDRSLGTEESAPLTRITPEVPFPETESNVDSYYANPLPLSEEHFLVGWARQKLPPHCRVDNTQQNPINAMGIYLYDTFGNLTLLHRDPNISSGYPIPLRPRVKPPVHNREVAWDQAQEGTFMLQDVYQGLAGVTRGSIKSLRVIAVPPKVQPHMNKPSIGISAEDPGKYLLGTVPVESDGSAYFRVPSGIPVFFQALDADGLAVQTMRTLTYVWPKQTLSCIGCHESREAAPTAASRHPLAALRQPSHLTPGPDGSWPLNYDRLVQPVLDKNCTSCHRPNSPDTKAARLDLTAPKSYDNLMNFANRDLHNLAKERDRSIVNETVARNSKLLAMLRADHANTRLDPQSLTRLITWMDLYAQRSGHYSDDQELQLRHLRQQLAPLFTTPTTPEPAPTVQK